MNLPIKLIKKEVVKEAAGNWPSEPTSTEYKLFAEVIEAGHGFRTYEAQTQLGIVRRFKVRFRFDKHPNGDWKISFRGKEWTIISIEQDEERLFYWIITANHK